MSKVSSEQYWNRHKNEYPFQISVKHMSNLDPDPRQVQIDVTFHFLRVPFNGEAHWGFKKEGDLDEFKKYIQK